MAHTALDLSTLTDKQQEVVAAFAKALVLGQEIGSKLGHSAKEGYVALDATKRMANAVRGVGDFMEFQSVMARVFKVGVALAINADPVKFGPDAGY